MAQMTHAAPELIVQTPHSQEITALSAAPDAVFCATAAKDRTVRLWNAKTHELLRLWRVPSVPAALVFARGGRFALSDGAAISAYSSSSETPLWRWKTPSGTRLQALCATPQGSYIVLGIDAKSRHSAFWHLSAADGTPRQLASSDIEWHEIAANGARLAAGDGKGHMALWDLATGRTLRFWKGHNSAVSSLAFSPDGQKLASGGDDFRVRFWGADGKPQRTVTANLHSVTSLAFSSDGNTLAALSGGQIKLWNTADGTLRGTVARLPEKSLMAFCGDTVVTSTLRSFDGRSGQELNPKPPLEEVLDPAPVKPAHFVFFTNNGELITAQTDSDAGGEIASLTRWGIAPQFLSTTLADPLDIYGFAAVKDGSLVAFIGDSAIYLWNSDGTRKSFAVEQGFWTNLAFSPDGKSLAVTFGLGDDNAGGALKFYDVATGKLLRKIKGLEHGTQHASYSADGKRLAVCAFKQSGRAAYEADFKAGIENDGSLFIFRVPDGKTEVVLRGYRGLTYQPAFSPDGKLIAAASQEKFVRLWNVDGAKPRELFRLPFPEGATGAVAFSPDGSVLAAAGSSFVRLWDVKTGRELRAWRGHDGFINELAWAPNGKVLATGSDDGTIAIWNVAPTTPRGSEERARLSAYSVWSKDATTTEWLAWTPRGEFACSPGAEKFLRWRDGDTLKTPAEVPELRRDDLVLRALRGE